MSRSRREKDCRYICPAAHSKHRLMTQKRAQTNRHRPATHDHLSLSSPMSSTAQAERLKADQALSRQLSGEFCLLDGCAGGLGEMVRSEEHTSELQSRFGI